VTRQALLRAGISARRLRVGQLKLLHEVGAHRKGTKGAEINLGTSSFKLNKSVLRARIHSKGVARLL